MASLHKHKMAARDSMLGSDVNLFKMSYFVMCYNVVCCSAVQVKSMVWALLVNSFWMHGGTKKV